MFLVNINNFGILLLKFLVIAQKMSLSNNFEFDIDIFMYLSNQCKNHVSLPILALLNECL